MVVFLVSLTGIPPTIGFNGKLALFYAGVNGGLTWLVVIAGLNSALSLFYYFRVAKELFLSQAEEEKAGEGEPALGGIIAALSAATVLTSLLFSDRMQNWSDAGSESLGIPPIQDEEAKR